MRWHIPLLIGLVCLSACAPSAGLSRSGFSTAEVIRGFTPDRGLEADYQIGQFIRFQFSLEQAGYVTLISADREGIYELERNVRVDAGPRSFPLRNDRNAQGEQAAYRIGPPDGAQRVVLLFTDRPGPDKNALKIEQAYSSAALESVVRSFFDGSGARIRDLSEFTITVGKK